MSFVFLRCHRLHLRRRLRCASACASTCQKSRSWLAFGDRVAISRLRWNASAARGLTRLCLLWRRPSIRSASGESKRNKRTASANLPRLPIAQVFPSSEPVLPPAAALHIIPLQIEYCSRPSLCPLELHFTRELFPSARA